jgi:hypothetical protein
MKELLVRVISKKRDGREAAVIASGYSSLLIYFRLATSRTPNRKPQAARDF